VARAIGRGVWLGGATWRRGRAWGCAHALSGSATTARARRWWVTGGTKTGEEQEVGGGETLMHGPPGTALEARVKRF
jgi:hypothetical protein